MKIRVFRASDGRYHFAEHHPEMVGQHSADVPALGLPHPYSQGYPSRLEAYRAGVHELAQLHITVTGVAGNDSQVRRWARQNGLTYEDLRGNQRRSTHGGQKGSRPYHRRLP